MSLSNYERVGKAVQLLAERLAPFVDRECRAKFGDDWPVVVQQRMDTRGGEGIPRRVNPADAQFLLKVMWAEWRTIFGKNLSRSDRNYVSELQGVRNDWAHNNTFSIDDALRALDTAQRLLGSVAAGAQANEVGKLHQDLLCQKYEQMPSTRRKDAPVQPESQPATGLPARRYGPHVSSLSIPSEVDLLYPTVCALRDLGGSGHKTEIDRKVIETEGFSEELVALRRPNGISPVEYRLGWVRTALKGIGVVVNTSGGYWSLTKKGLTIDEVKIRSDHADYRREITQKSKPAEPMLPNPDIPERYGPHVSSLSIPSEVDLLYPTVCALRDLGGSGRKAELVRRVVETEGYSSNGELMALKRRLGWVLTALKGIDVVVNTSRGYWSLTNKGLTIDEVKIRSDHADYRKRIT